MPGNGYAVYYDTETTGIRAVNDRVIELAAYIPEKNQTFEMLIHPGFPIPPEATAIHHITDEMVANSPPFSEILQPFIDFCGADPILIAHNNDAFDIHFIREEFKRCGSEIPENWRFFDTLKWARRYRPDLPRHSLQFLREIYQISENNAHRALDDVKVLHDVFRQMLGDLHIEDAFELLNMPRVLKQMPFGKHQGKPFAKVPKDYLSWLAGSGALDKPENNELKQTLEQLQLISASG